MTPAQIAAAQRTLEKLKAAEANLARLQALAFSDKAKSLANQRGNAGILQLVTPEGMIALDVPPRAIVLDSMEMLLKLRVVQAQDACRAAGVTL